MEDEFELPDSLSQALAGNTRGVSFSSATRGVRFPPVDDLATLPRNAKYVGLGKRRKTSSYCVARPGLSRSRPCRPRPML